MLIQHWTLKANQSRWLQRLRLLLALSLACYAGWVVAYVTGVIGVGGWWGDWLWPWPMLLYGSWVVAYLPAPEQPATHRLMLTEAGQFNQLQIHHSLRTPWLIALQLGPALTTFPHNVDSIQHPRHWVWVVRDQLSLEHWTRLNRVCQNVSTGARPTT